MSLSQATRPDPAKPLESAALAPSPDWNRRGESSQVEIPFSYYWFLIHRRRGPIATLVLLTTVAVTLLALSLHKVYAATAIVRVDPSGLHVVGDSHNPDNAGADARLLVATEAAVITSPAVVQQASDQLHLAEIPEFQAKLPANATAAQRATALLRTVGEHIVVSQPLDTLLLEIQFRSRDPQLAARAANGLAQSFLEHEYATRAKALTDSTAYMADQIDALRAQMEKDQIALVDYESSHDVIDPDDRANIYQARLSQINNQLTQAQTSRMSLQADAQAAATGDFDALMASPRGQALVPLHDRYLSDQRELTHLGTIYGAAHPLYRQQQAVVQHDQQVLQEQQQHLAAQLRDRYAVALDNERLLAASLDQEKRSVDAFNLRAVRYHALKAAADSSMNLYYDLQKQIQDATVAAGQRSEDLRIISPAVPVTLPVSPRVILWAVLAFLLSTLVGVGAAVLQGVLDKSISSVEQVERWFNLPVMGSLPEVDSKTSIASLSPRQIPSLAMAEAGDAADSSHHSPFEEAVLALHSSLAFALDRSTNALVITSSLPAEGKSTVSANLAATMATLGQRVLLVDADMRKPSIHRKFDLPNRVGLSDLLRRGCSPAEALVPIGANLTVLPAGSRLSNPAELLHLHFETVLAQLRPQFDFVLVDSPPLLGFADALNIAAVVGEVLVVVHAGATDRGNFNTAVRQLRASGTNVLGVILNRVSHAIGQYYGYYNSQSYSYYGGDEGDDN